MGKLELGRKKKRVENYGKAVSLYAILENIHFTLSLRCYHSHLKNLYFLYSGTQLAKFTFFFSSPNGFLVGGEEKKNVTW